MTSTHEHTTSPTAPPDRPATAPPSGTVVDDRRPPGGAGLARRLLSGRPTDPRWIRPALLCLLVATAVLNLWTLSESGWANSFYAAAVQAGTESWRAFFYGASDAAGSITVDKTPASLWVMAISGRIFGFSSWSMLAPQALMGVGTVALVYASVRRRFGAGAGLLAGAVLALTPVAALMFRFNNPDALLVLLLTAGAYATLRALEGASTRWIMLAATFVGLGFLTKMLQALLVVPAFALVYLVAAPTPVRRRITQLLLAGLALVVSAGWWVAIVELVPASYRPYIGGSQHNSVLELVLGYNGLGRLTGNETGSVGSGGNWGATGWSRLFSAEMGGQVAWLLPAALILLSAGGWLTRRATRVDGARAAFALWGGWLLVTGLTFSFMQGIFHAYYTVALAPAVAALVGMGAALLWRRRAHIAVAATLAATVAVTSAWAFVLLGRSADWYPWLRYAVLVVGLVAALLLAVVDRLRRRVAVTAAALALAAGLAGPAAYTVQTVGTAHTGSIVTAGPPVAGGMGRPGGGTMGAPAGGGPRGLRGVGLRPGGPAGGFRPGLPGPGTGMGGLLNGASVSESMTALLSVDASSYRWVAATVGSNNAASYQLATGDPVMAVGGFNGTDPSPTLAQFQQLVRQGKIHYFISSGLPGRGATGGSDAAQQIASWVASAFTSRAVGGVTVYDLTAAAAG